MRKQFLAITFSLCASYSQGVVGAENMSAEPIKELSGVGSRLCKEWTVARLTPVFIADKSAFVAEVQAWMQGFLTAINMQQATTLGKYPMHFPSADVLKYMLDQQCDKEADREILFAVLDVARVLGKHYPGN